jgi:hypothetical protein
VKPVSTILALVVGLSAATVVSPAVAATAADAGSCATCHADELASLVGTGGHSSLTNCAGCHADRRPNRVGRRHRAVPLCADCHMEETTHPERLATAKGRRANRNCLACHDVHGSANLRLVNERIRWRQRVTAITFTSEAGAGPGGFTDPANPGHGLCENCHRTTKFYRSDGTGDPHFTATCTDCHAHADHFAPVADDANCALCHVVQAAQFAKPSGHSARFAECSGCHAEVSPTPGPGHRAVESCETCHATPATHAPPGVPALPCAQCHNPHGSDNIRLVGDVLHTVQGTNVPIHFTNLDGVADGGFASASAPGTGVCEVCHTTTKFYRADGTGAPHYTFSCLPCHRHEKGFNPQ